MNSALSSLQVSLASGVVGQACGDGLLVSVEGVLTLVCGTTFCDLIGDLAIRHWGGIDSSVIFSCKLGGSCKLTI